MYSKSKGMTDRDYTLTPPPGYDGSRFRRRSDGRDDSFPPYSEDSRISGQPFGRCRQRRNTYEREHDKYCSSAVTEDPDEVACPDEDICEDCPDFPCEESTEDDSPCEKEEMKDRSVLPFLGELGSEEILLISLIVLLAGNQSRQGMETVLILALLLCVS